MPYIVMGIDECGSEFRPSIKEHKTRESAIKELEICRDQYVEARNMWVERLAGHRSLLWGNQ